jgi:hypothetical protein
MDDKEEIKKLKEVLLEMLHQHGDNYALSSNEAACAALGHPRAEKPCYKGDACYCRDKKYNNSPPTDSEEFAKNWAYLLLCNLMTEEDPLFMASLKQTTTSLLGYRKLLIEVIENKKK